MMNARGAEAVISAERGAVLKNRVVKGYRLRQLDDRLRRQRTRAEASLMRAARRAGVSVPQVLDEGEYSISMEMIEGDKLRDIFEGDYGELSKKVAAAVARLHGRDIVHGDLTTSNMLLRGDELFVIDFGLGFASQRNEDKAVDLWVLHEALEATHSGVLEKAWNIILNTYRKDYPEAEGVLAALKKIERRRRYAKDTFS